jgi:hypothetical protein
MKSRLLLPHKYKKFGWIIFVPSLLFGLFIMFKINGIEEISFFKTNVFAIMSKQLFSNKIYFTFVENNITDELILVFVTLGAYLIAFSKEKVEDEFIAQVRLESLLWSVFINTIIIFIATIFIYDEFYWYVMYLNIVSTLIIFIARFNFIIWKDSKGISNE